MTANNCCSVPDCDREAYCRGLCRGHYSRLKRIGDVQADVPLRPRRILSDTCSVDGCDELRMEQKSIGMRYSMCGPHRGRAIRGLPVDGYARQVAVAGTGCVNNSGYWVEVCHRHPVAGKYGRLLRHRRVLYDAIGGDPTRCHWCETEVRWDADFGAPDYLQGDHLNGDKTDDRASNLVPSCGPCNSRRASRGNPQDYVPLTA